MDGRCLVHLDLEGQFRTNTTTLDTTIQVTPFMICLGSFLGLAYYTALRKNIL
jgi:hypothetical protein